MQFITCDVATYCIGQAASMGAILLTAGAAGKRHSLPNSRIMIHQPLAGMYGTAEDIAIHREELRRVKRRMNEILLKHTGQSLARIEKDTDRDKWMAATEAVEYRLIDQVIEMEGERHADFDRILVAPRPRKRQIRARRRLHRFVPAVDLHEDALRGPARHAHFQIEASVAFDDDPRRVGVGIVGDLLDGDVPLHLALLLGLEDSFQHVLAQL